MEAEVAITADEMDTMVHEVVIMALAVAIVILAVTVEWAGIVVTHLTRRTLTTVEVTPITVVATSVPVTRQVTQSIPTVVAAIPARLRLRFIQPLALVINRIHLRK